MDKRRMLWVVALFVGFRFSVANAQEPAASASSTPATTEGTEKPPSVDESTAALNRELRSVEQDVTSLKERVFRSKATLQLLRELVLDSSSVGSRVTLWHVNKMGPAYTLESVQYFLDGKNVFTKMDTTGALDSEREIELLAQAMPPGTHSLQVTMFLRGNGLGVFSYLQTYSFKVQSSYSFTVEDGKETTVRVIANERGGPWRTFVDRPNVQYDERSGSLKGTE